MIREFRLSPPGKREGVSCDEDGAFVGAIPLLKRSAANGKDYWQPIDAEQLSAEFSSEFGLPVDMSRKMGGLKTIAKALNTGDVARAQIATVLLGIPDPPRLSKTANARDTMIKFIRDLHWSGMIKADWVSEKHPRWPAGAPDRQGGQFAPKGDGAAADEGPAPESMSTEQRTLSPLVPIAANSRDDISRNPPGRKSEEECDRQYESDLYVCGSLRDKREAAVCRSSAAQRYAACLRGKPLPPLTLPEPDYDFRPMPSAPPSRSWPSRPPPWLPLFFVPWFFGVPA